MLKQIILFEKKTLIRGFIVCFICIFPFTFAPVIFSSNNSFHDFLNRIPESLLYTVLFSIVVAVVALISNYQKLQVKEFLFKKPAFRTLGFQLQVEGMNSIVKELSLFLIGRYGNIHYKIDIQIDDNDMKKYQIKLCPLLLIEIQNNKELVKRLKKNYQTDNFDTLSILLSPNELDLDNATYISKHMAIINAEVQNFQSASDTSR